MDILYQGCEEILLPELLACSKTFQAHPEHTFSSDFEARMQNILQAHEPEAKRPRIRKSTRYAIAILVAASLLIAAMSAAASENIRHWLSGMFAANADETVRINYVDDGFAIDWSVNSTDIGNTPETIPGGFTRTSCNSIGYGCSTSEYTNPEGQSFELCITPINTEFIVNVDASDAEAIRIEGYTAYLTEDEMRSLIWVNSNFCYQIIGNIDKETIISIYNFVISNK